MIVRRLKNPEIYSRLYPSAVYDALEHCGARVLKSRDESGRSILYFKTAAWNPSQVPVDDFLLAMMLLGWEMLAAKETQINGVVVLMDGTGFSLAHARTATPGNVSKYVNLILVRKTDKA